MATPTSYTPKRLWASAQVPAADTLMYTSPAGPALGTQVQGIIAVNTSAAPVTLRVTVGAMAVAGALCWDFSVPADGLPHNILADLPQGKMLNASDVIRAQAGTAASVTLHGDGNELA